MFAKKFPERFFEVGVAEQNLMGAAAGLASCGKVPFVSTFAVFATERAFNQIKQCIAYPALNVKIVVSHSGFTPSGDGASHQTFIDVSLMRSLPNMVVIVPADAIQTEKAIEAAANFQGPVYIRLGKIEVPVIFNQNYEFKIGGSDLINDGQDATIFSTGIMLSKAIEAVEIAKKEGISVRLVNIHTIKPIDKNSIIASAKKTGAVVTVEEHSIIGGLGSAVAEILGENMPVPMERVGVNDTFGESGSPEKLYEKYKLTSENIYNIVKSVITKKSMI